MPSFIDKTGERNGRLVVLCEASERTTGGRIRWHCRCDCGNECIVTGMDMAPGRSQSCGCLQKEKTVAANKSRKTHGHSSGLTADGKRKRSPEYNSWNSMQDRCLIEAMPNYHLYGGRGITICDRWLGSNGFINFLADMGTRPIGQTLDRIDTNGNYEPSNCKWSTGSEQAKNRRKTPEYMARMKANLDAGRKNRRRSPPKKEYSHGSFSTRKASY